MVRILETRSIKHLHEEHGFRNSIYAGALSATVSLLKSVYQQVYRQREGTGVQARESKYMRGAAALLDPHQLPSSTPDTQNAEAFCREHAVPARINCLVECCNISPWLVEGHGCFALAPSLRRALALNADVFGPVTTMHRLLGITYMIGGRTLCAPASQVSHAVAHRCRKIEAISPHSAGRLAVPLDWALASLRRCRPRQMDRPCRDRALGRTRSYKTLGFALVGRAWHASRTPALCTAFRGPAPSMACTC